MFLMFKECHILLDNFGYSEKTHKEIHKNGKKTRVPQTWPGDGKSNKQVSKCYFFLNSTVIYAKSS